MSLHRFVMNAETLKEWHDFKTEAINVSRTRAAAARAHTMAEKNNWNSGTQPMDVDAVSKGTGQGRGSKSRICHNFGKLGDLMKVCWSSKCMKTGGKGKGKNGKSKGTDKGIKGKRSEGTKSLLGTRNTVNCLEIRKLWSLRTRRQKHRTCWRMWDW